ncbi:MAG: hypothetical protein WDM90_24590 [Ferruginibacter sp.]
MRYFFIVFIAALFSCNQSDKAKDDADIPAAPAKAAPPEDSATARIRVIITTIETNELTQVNPIKSLSIDSIRHEMISLRDFYSVQKEQLSKMMVHSTDKEKTEKALAYLDKMKAASSSKPVVYKIQFHLNALLTNSTVYNNEHTKYLNEDLKEIVVTYPQ